MTTPTSQLPITRVDIYLQPDGHTDLHIYRGGEVPEIRLANADFETAVKYFEEHPDYCVRRWSSDIFGTGARAWKADQPEPIRTRAEIARKRAILRRYHPTATYNFTTCGLDLAYDT